MKEKIRKVSSYSMAGGLGLAFMAALTGCSDHREEEQAFTQAAQKEGYFIVIQQTGEKEYKIVEQYPSGSGTRAILRDMNGQERVLSEEELRQLSAEEQQRVADGSSNLLQPEGAMGGGMSLGEAILASAAGAIIGNMIANKLMNNPNYQTRTKANPPITRPAKPAAPKASTTTNKPKSGYMQNTQKKSSFGFGG